MSLAVLVYALCASAALLCTLLLVRGYLKTRTRLLFWSAVCFGCLTVNNLLVITDLVIFPGVDLAIWRTVSALVGVSVLLFALLWAERR
jgi:hypothetical protein